MVWILKHRNDPANLTSLGDLVADMLRWYLPIAAETYNEGRPFGPKVWWALRQQDGRARAARSSQRRTGKHRGLSISFWGAAWCRRDDHLRVLLARRDRR